MEIEINYLPKGYTHENVDRFFSLLKKLLKTKSALTLEDLYSLWKQAYHHQQPSAELHELSTVWDWKL